VFDYVSKERGEGEETNGVPQSAKGHDSQLCRQPFVETTGVGDVTSYGQSGNVWCEKAGGSVCLTGASGYAHNRNRR
jgi:hypothetical protein